MYVFLNGRMVPEPDALVSVYDHGFLYGDGIYETMRSYEGVVFMLERHAARLRRSASYMKMSIAGFEYVRDAVYQTLEANNLTDAYIRVTVSRGKGPVGLDPALCREPTFVVIAEKFIPYPETLYRDGVRLIIAETRRNLVEALNPRIKSLNFLNNIFAKMEAKERGAYESIMLNSKGFLAEGTISNIFFVRDNILCTPSLEAGVLDGITRELIISAAKSMGIGVHEGMFYPEDLFSASEVFFTNTTAEVMPVSFVEETTYEPGEITLTLRETYRKVVKEYIRHVQSADESP